VVERPTPAGTEVAVSHVVGLVLGAGASQRMGTPKAGLRWRGRTFVDLAVRALADGGATPVVVVTGALDPEAMAEHLRADATVVHNARWRDGPTGSLQVGLRRAQAHEGCAAVVLHTLDRPRVRGATVRTLLDAWRSTPGVVWQPRHDGHPGHPVLWPAEAFAHLLALGPDQTRRDVLEGPFADRHHLVDVDDPGVVDNVDDPNALAGLI